jgi:hypothetical protein
MKSNRFILLTGAGFSANFGTPLATELWATIMNHSSIQREPRVREAVLSDFDFESIYHSIMSGDYTTEEKEAMARGVADAYAYIDEIVKKCKSRYPISASNVQRLINRFAGTSASPGFFFTLNQDLLVERHFRTEGHLHLPGIPVMDIGLSGIRGPNSVVLPGPKASQESTLFQSEKFFYLKLHGSSNWLSADGANRMVIGQEKAAQIQKEPLLSKYFETFTEVLAKEDHRLLVIGYSFRDSHVNRIIANAVKEHGLRVFVMSPEPPVDLHKRLDLDESGRQIWEGLGGYFPWALSTVFPEDQSDTSEWGLVKKHYFEGSK